MKNIKEIQVNDPEVVIDRLHELINQKLWVEDSYGLISVKDDNNNCICFVANEFYANIIYKIPEMLQFTQMLEDMLKGMGAEKAMIRQSIEEFLNDIK